MQQRTLGQSQIKASVVGLGAWAIGGWMWGGAEVEQSVSAIRTAVEGGVNLVDTAPIYGFGESERVVGRAIRGIREQVVLATKCGLVWDRERGVFAFDSDEKSIGGKVYRVYKYLGAESIRRELESSLRRLDTDYVDLYQTHWQEESTPIEETMETLLKLKQEGKIRAIGVSNATPEQMRRYQAVGPLDSDQELYSMLDRKHEGGNLPFCREQKMAFLAYSPLARGLLTGRATPERQFEEGDARAGMARFSVENRRRAQDMLERMRPIAERHGCGLAQLALAWAFHQPGCSHVLCGVRNSGQAEAAVAAGEVVLRESEQAEVDSLLREFSDIV